MLNIIRKKKKKQNKINSKLQLIQMKQVIIEKKK